MLPRWFRNRTDGYPLFFKPFTAFFKRIESRIKICTKPAYVLFAFEKSWQNNQPLRQPWHLNVDEMLSIVFELEWWARYWISNVSLFSWYGLTIKYCVLCLVSKKYHIYIYGEKQQFIVITIGAQSQQGNVIPIYVRSHTRSFQDRTSNFLAWKVFYQHPPPLQGVLQLQGPVYIDPIINVTRTKLRRLMRWLHIDAKNFIQIYQ